MKKKLPVIFLTFANDKIDDALYLRNLPKELHGIRTALDKAVKAGLCELIERTAATVDDIFDTFQDPHYKDRIAIFHYGGHASGSQLMLETLDGGHGASHSDGLMPFLGRQKGLQVAFFNGCSSQQQALELSEAGVPAVIGTATAINDAVATELASRFYNGMASGSTIYQSWLEAIDILKTKNDTKKRKGLKLRRDKGSSDFPWNMYIRDGAEIVKEWNLPNAAQNPLFGLPKLPKMNLPEEPFRFLRRYEPEHAEIFFGRGRYIRQLYDRITSEKAAPIILFYGQSGAGKSSALASGLLPRLEKEADVKYIRRDPNIGLLGTLDEALGGSFKSAVVRNENGTTILVSDIQSQIQQLETIKDTLVVEEQDVIQSVIVSLQKRLEQQNVDIDTKNTTSRLECWKSIETKIGRPFHVLLDQVEEVFTRFNPEIDNELEHLLLEIQQIFADPNEAPKGKIILSYRKEYHPEIEEFCKKLQIPREGIFLKKLEKEDIISVVNGVNSTENLRQRYKVTVEPELAKVIADDLLEDKDSPIAPVLSILLTKLWKLSRKEETSVFSIAQYQSLKKEGILMDDFFHQQMEKLRDWKPELEESGLALDVLNYHTTALGTAGSQSVELLRERYQHQSNEIDELLTQFKELYLLTDAGAKQTGLAHDTLAPIIIKEIRNSDKSGQRALRILTGKANEFKADKRNLLDNTDLKLVEDGEKGMRLWSSLEEELIEASQKRRKKQKALRRNLVVLGIIAVLIISGLGLFSFREWQNGKSSELIGKAIIAFNKFDYIESFMNAKKAYNRNPQNYLSTEYLIRSHYSNIYKLDRTFHTTPTSSRKFNNPDKVLFAKDNKLLIIKEKKENQYSVEVKYIKGETLLQFDMQTEYPNAPYGISNTGRYFIYNEKSSTILIDLENNGNKIKLGFNLELSNISQALSSDDKYCVYINNSTIMILDIEQMQVVQKISSPHEGRAEVGFLLEGEQAFLIVYNDFSTISNRVMIYSSKNGREVYNQNIEYSDINHDVVKLSPSGQFIYIYKHMDKKSFLLERKTGNKLNINKLEFRYDDGWKLKISDAKNISISDKDYIFLEKMNNHKVNKVVKNMMIVDEGAFFSIKNSKKEPLLRLIGSFEDMSSDGRYIATKEELYDLKENFYAVGVRPIQGVNIEASDVQYYFSTDGKYLIHDDRIENIISATDIETNKKIGLDKQKKKELSKARITFEQGSFIENGVFKLRSADEIKVTHNDMVAKKINDKISIFKNENLLTQLEAMGEEIIYFCFRANGDALEIASLKTIDDTETNWAGLYGDYEIQTQLIWLTPEKFVKNDK
jgi:hypothetical protein